MTPVAASLLVSFWILVVGTVGVYFEVASVHCGVRVRGLLSKESELLDQVRRAEMTYNELVSPDVLEGELPEHFRRFDYPIPTEEEIEAAEEARKREFAIAE
ncbi:MAG: hypothetical protein AAF517_23345 [Planctomycetota bacterium]